MLPVNCNAVGLPNPTTSSTPSSTTAPAVRPVPHVAPFASVPLNPPPEAFTTVDPAPSLNAYATTAGGDAGVVLTTLTGTAADRVVLPAASRASAVNVCAP